MLHEWSVASMNNFFSGSNQLDKSLLHLACEKGHEACACLLLEKGANINVVDGWFQTPLMYAVCTQRENIVNFLLQRRPEMDKQDK